MDETWAIVPCLSLVRQVYYCLCQGGDFAFPAGCPRRPCPADDLWVTLKHHCKEGWPSDSENIAKHPLIARPGWFSDESKRKTTPAASASVASPNFL